MNDFNWFALIWPAALIVFVAFFFMGYRRDVMPRSGRGGGRRAAGTSGGRDGADGAGKAGSSKASDSRSDSRKPGSISGSISGSMPGNKASAENKASSRAGSKASAGNKGGGKKHGGAALRPRLSLEGQPGRMTKRDWLIALALTVAYGALAFSFTGDTEAPQTFWRAYKDQPPLVLDLGEVVELDNIVYYTGVSVIEGASNWLLELSQDGQQWRIQPDMQQDIWESFRWKIPILEGSGEPIPTRYIRITTVYDGVELGELALVVINEDGKRALMDSSYLSMRHPQYAALFDEQHLIPDLPDMSNAAMLEMLSRRNNIETTMGTISDKNNSMIFDEFYHARTSYDYIRNIKPYEYTHPPLGKLIIAIGIKLFGMTPFGWRFMGILFGVLMIPLFYIFVKNLFAHTEVAFCGAALLAFENMHFAQTHLATIDTYVVFFIIAMYLFMFRYISSGYDAPFRKTLPALFLCGLSFALGAATKWTGFYAALGLIALYAAYLVQRGKHQIADGRKREYRAFLWRTLAASVLFFAVIPFIIYTVSYIPHVSAEGNHPLTPGGLLSGMWRIQKQMLGYHTSSWVENHPSYSLWWEWMLNLRPIYYYSRVYEGSRTVFGAITNPLVAIGGLAAVCVSIYDLVRKKSKEALVIVVGYFAQLAPWMLVTRSTFAYHYFPSVIFLTLAICYIFSNILKYCPERKWRVRIYAFTGAAIGLFFLLLPPTAGFEMPDWYFTWFVRWLPTWPL